MGFINKLAYILVVIGALNWGLVGLGDFDIVAALFGPLSTFSSITYCLVGLSGIWMIIAPFLHDHDNK
jgi:uncharacterized membrane protein YuzA (DUF378 family)